MKSIYRNEQSKKAVWKLYDRHMENLDAPYTDLYIDISFGRTHLIECGNLTGKPLLVCQMHSSDGNNRKQYYRGYFDYRTQQY